MRIIASGSDSIPSRKDSLCDNASQADPPELCLPQAFGELVLVFVVAIGLLRLFTEVGLPDWGAGVAAVLAALALDRRWAR